MKRVASALVLAATVSLPATAMAQFNLSGFVGPVTISYFDSCEWATTSLCIKAAVGSGRNSSGRYFARLLDFEDTFGGANPFYTYISHHVTDLVQFYESPVPTDPYAEGDWTWFQSYNASPTWSMETQDYGSPVFIGPMQVSWNVLVAITDDDDDGPYGFEEMGWFAVSRVTTTPEPATLTMVGAGMIAVLGYRIRRRKD